jgi:hypothetical protein
MTSKLSPFLVGLWLHAAFGSPSLGAQTLPRLADTDVVVAGIGMYNPQNVVQELLGRPDSARHGGSDWYYRGLTVSFADGAVWVIALETPKYHTARGLRVGDSVARARRLYGPSPGTGDQLVYCGTDAAPDQGMRVYFVGARITEIAVGILCQD